MMFRCADYEGVGVGAVVQVLISAAAELQRFRGHAGSIAGAGISNLQRCAEVCRGAA